MIANLLVGSNDRVIRIFDFMTGTEERELRGHGYDVKCVDWHPHKGLLVSGSKDSQQPIILWDLTSGEKLTTLHAHKNTCMALKWNRHNENWLISASRDHSCMDDAHEGMIWDMSWHPLGHMLVSGSNDHTTRFWTRNRSGDTVLEHNEEGLLLHRKNDALEHERSEEMNTPGLDFEGGLLE
ncbi:unnamed protein product [Adineta steineri]|uniref:Uncharacterized protein n=1 Tax=Adineta steineri TaxID=433720 RepID=A0A819LQS1_9BILA|nr:unnamed protein product [Adineta steineri]